jgi:hypothetical protein
MASELGISMFTETSVHIRNTVDNMNSEDIGLPPHLQRMVNAGVSGLDILHGELKNLMLIAEQDLADALEQEELSEEAMDSMVRTEATGRLDTLVDLYNLTYQLSFAIGEKK